MSAYGETCAGVVSEQAVFCGHLLQGESLRVFQQRCAVLSKEGTLQLAGTLHLPEGVAAMIDSVEFVECSDAGEDG
jgi:hypothetical protein